MRCSPLLAHCFLFDPQHASDPSSLLVFLCSPPDPQAGHVRLDHLTVDIDMNTFWVLREILQAGYRPRYVFFLVCACV
jgi:hypothetical protein